MAGKKTKRQIADEAWERAQQTSLEPPPDLHGQLPGQLDIGGQIVGESHSTPLPEVRELPEVCPACGAGGRGILLWSHMLGGEKVQCVKCGYVLGVTRRTWDSVQAAAKATFGGRQQPKVHHNPRRERGAG